MTISVKESIQFNSNRVDRMKEEIDLNILERPNCEINVSLKRFTLTNKEAEHIRNQYEDAGWHNVSIECRSDMNRYMIPSVSVKMSPFPVRKKGILSFLKANT